MPARKSSSQPPLRDSWLPAQMFLQPSVERDDAEIEALDLARMDEDPFMYFLTPTPSSYSADDAMDFDMEFDAGIEDAKHPPQIVRSISPSSLGGIGRPPPPQPPTPPRSPATPDLDYDLSATPDEHEQYDYMDHSWPPVRAHPLSLPRRLKVKFRGHAKHDMGNSSADSLLLPPASPYAPPRASTRGRAVSRSGPQPVAAPAGSRTRRSRARLSPHAWREPSPDVWSIEEEAEEEQGVETQESVLGAVDIPAAKPKKKVRFVLPAMGDGGAAAY